jgi:hypothetical protein
LGKSFDKNMENLDRKIFFGYENFPEIPEIKNHRKTKSLNP